MTALSSPKRICSLRGPGEMLGKRQSGMEEFRLADPIAHGDLLAVAHDDARLVLARDPELKSPRGEALRVLLYLFGRDEAVRYLRDRMKMSRRNGRRHFTHCCTETSKLTRKRAGKKEPRRRRGSFRSVAFY